MLLARNALLSGRKKKGHGHFIVKDIKRFLGVKRVEILKIKRIMMIVINLVL